MDSENNKVFYTNPVEASQASLRIDKYIAGEIRDFSRAQVQRLIEEGFVLRRGLSNPAVSRLPEKSTAL